MQCGEVLPKFIFSRQNLLENIRHMEAAIYG